MTVYLVEFLQFSLGYFLLSLSPHNIGDTRTLGEEPLGLIYDMFWQTTFKCLAHDPLADLLFSVDLVLYRDLEAEIHHSGIKEGRATLVRIGGVKSIQPLQSRIMGNINKIINYAGDFL